MNQSSNTPKYNLEERLAQFAESLIDLAKSMKISPLNKRIIEQLIGASGSAGANYCEATEAESKKDFIHKIAIVKKELKESKHWLRLLSKVHSERKEELRVHWKEAHELLLIFAKISRSSRGAPKIEA